MKHGDVVTYHGRKVTVLDVGTTKAPLSGADVTIVRVQDPRRGMRVLFEWQLAETEAPKPKRTPEPGSFIRP